MAMGNPTAAHPHPTQSELLSDSRPLDFERAQVESNLQNKVIIVTGGGHGLGLTMAEALFQGGANVHCLDMLEQPHQDFVAVQTRTDIFLGGALHYHPLDLYDTKTLQQLVADIADKYERIDGLIAAAGIQGAQDAGNSENLMDANLTAILKTVQEVGEQMLRYDTPGSIVLVAGMGAIDNTSGDAAIDQLTKSFAAKWSKKGIRVNSLCPGNPSPGLPHHSSSTNTPMVTQNLEDEPGLRKQWEKESIPDRVSTPGEFRGPATFLISNASSYMTGASLVINGGGRTAS